jgi:hypothetical protein
MCVRTCVKHAQMVTIPTTRAGSQVVMLNSAPCWRARGASPDVACLVVCVCACCVLAGLHSMSWFTAHPKVDPSTEYLYSFGYNLEVKPYLAYYPVRCLGWCACAEG